MGAAARPPEPADREHAERVSRRNFLARSAVASAGLAVGTSAAVGAPPAVAAETGTPGENLIDVTLTVNGRAERLRTDPRVTLLDALRDRLQLTGTKKGCDRGQCGACTVHIGDRRVLSCLTLAASADGRQVTTIEGLAQPSGNADRLHPMQQAFIDQDAFQCGFCTSGQIMSAVAVVAEGHATSDARIRESMAGNICRCGAYEHIVAAIKTAGGARVTG